MIRRENRSTKMSRNDIKTCEYSPNQDFSPSVNQPSMLMSKPYKDHNLNLNQDYNSNVLTLPPLKPEQNMIRNAKRRASFNVNIWTSGSLIPTLLSSENKQSFVNAQEVKTKNLNQANRLNPSSYASFKNIPRYQGASNLSKIDEETNQSTHKYIFQREAQNNPENSRFSRSKCINLQSNINKIASKI